MINEIQMSAVASFKQSTSIDTDKKVNLIYGLNGTGKSTISNFLYESSNPNFAQCKKIPQQTDPILVYNQNFIQDNFYEPNRLKGIFSLSKENKAAEEKIDKASSTLRILNERLKVLLADKKKLSEDSDALYRQAADDVWRIKTAYTGGDRVLEYCLDGLKGQKDKLFSHLLSIAKPENEPTKTIKELRAEVEAIKGDSAQKQNELSALTFTAHDVESNPIFGKAIIGNSDSEVAEIIEKIGNADWVYQGLSYLPENEIEDAQPCPFCQESTITFKLVESIKGYFDDTYKNQMEVLEKLHTEYTDARNRILDISSYTNHRFAVKRAASLTKKHQALLDFLTANITCIENKIKTPKQPQKINSSAALLSAFNDEVLAINEEIQAYNKRLTGRDDALQSLKDDFWSIMRWQYDQTIARLNKDTQSKKQELQKTEEQITKISASITSANSDIATAQKEVVNLDEAVDAINANLLSLGMDGFKVTKHSESLYRVVRTDQPEDTFHTLSEGEKMMISFLYFCELSKGRLSADDTSTKRIVVIDDPISSLSHIFVFNVGQLIKSLFFNSELFTQVFILTHSLYFFYELTDTNHERRKVTQKLFRISKSTTGSQIQEMRYEEIQNDYQTYWAIINDPNQPPALIANCMRSTIEYFFSFVRKKDLNNVFQMPELQDNKFQAFCRYVNRESHSLGQNIVDMKEFDYAIFKEGLKLVFSRTGYSDHFDAMSKV